MGLEIAVEELYATGWVGLDSTGCSHDTDGRAYPGVDRVRREIEVAGYEFEVGRVDQFGCYRAEWTGPGGEEGGSVVGRTEAEAAVYARAQQRRQLVAAGV